MQGFVPKNLLITGGMGFIGSNFIRFFLNQNENIKIINLDLKTYAADDANLKNLPNAKNHTLIIGNITDRPLVDSLFETFDIDTVLHFAAESHVDRSIDNPTIFVDTNIVGTSTLLEAARYFWLINKKLNHQNCRFYHISTDEIYGSCPINGSSFSEGSPYKPSSPYAASKAAANHLVAAYHNTYQLPTLISNCSNNFGPYQHKEKLIPKIIDCCLNMEPIPIYGDGSNVRDWLYVEDHCAAIKCILEQASPGSEYNIGANNELSNNQVSSIICKMMDELQPRRVPYHRLIEFVKDRPGHDVHYSLDTNKIRKALKWTSKTEFLVGISKTIKFYVKNL